MKIFRKTVALLRILRYYMGIGRYDERKIAMNPEYNEKSLDTLCAALCYAMGVDAPKEAAEANTTLTEYVDKAFGGEKADRIVMYNPDAIAQWIWEKYPQLVREVAEKTQLRLPLRSVMPSVTPVCFGTMYTGAQPAVHGIQRYEKPVITIDTIFDALLRAGRKPVILSYGKASLSKIFLEREMDYFLFDNIAQVNAKAVELIKEDKYDFYVIYNGNYDGLMHKNGPESINTLGELRINSHAFAMLEETIRKHWKDHRTLLGFAMDHGCHEIDDGGSHGLDMPEDLNIVHSYIAMIGENVQ